MNRFVIVDGLPFLLAGKKTYGVRWDENGFTVGTEVEMASVPDVTYSELSILAKCQGCLDSISKQPEQEDKPEDTKQPEQEDELAKMKVAELKAFADENGVDLGEATKKAEILDAIRKAVGQDVNADDSDA